MKLTDSFEKISPIEFDKFISTHGLTLPKSYTEFIQSNNGGYPDKSTFYAESLGLAFEIDFFYAIDSNYQDKDVLESLDDLVTVNEIIDEYQIEEKALPSFLYPFGQNSGGATYCISTRDRDFGVIYLHYWDGSDLQFIAHSFIEFLEGLDLV